MKKLLNQKSTRNEQEIAHFSATSDDWWNLSGAFAPLHRLTPVRMRFIKDSLPPIKGLNIVDIGCGGGLMCEPLSRLGANITGVDADTNAIRVAQKHADAQNLNINYINATAEDLVLEDKQFDVVLALEIIEHVNNPDFFIEMTSKLVKKGGIIIYSTLNRTVKSYALGIVAAERILKWVPHGTHDWQKFIKPSELTQMVENVGLTPEKLMGIAYNPLKGQFHLAPHDLDVNYFLVAKK